MEGGIWDKCKVIDKKREYCSHKTWRVMEWNIYSFFEMTKASRVEGAIFLDEEF